MLEENIWSIDDLRHRLYLFEMHGSIGVLHYLLSRVHVRLFDEVEVGIRALWTKNLALIHIDLVIFHDLLNISENFVNLLVLNTLIVEYVKLLNLLRLESFIRHEVINVIWREHEQEPTIFVFGLV